MTITPLPEAPSTADPTNFEAKADALLSQLPTMVAQFNTDIAGINAAVASTSAAAAIAQASAAAAAGSTAYSGTSTSSASLTTGSKTINLAETGKGFAVGDQVTLIRRSNGATRMRGLYTAFNSGTGAGTININEIPLGVSGGPFTDWLVILTGLEPPSEASLKAFAVAMAISL